MSSGASEMKHNRGLFALGALAALCVPALVLAQVAQFRDGNVLNASSLNPLVDAVNGQAAGASGFVESLLANGATAVSRVYTAHGDGIVTFVPAGSGVRGVTSSVQTNIDGAANTIGRAFDGNSVAVGVRNNQQFTLTITAAAGTTPSVGVFWIPMRGNAPEPTF
jgi:hypothetical protein